MIGRKIKNLNKKTVDLIEIRRAVADYISSEGCGCCSDSDGHKTHQEKLAKLLKVRKYVGGSGFNFSHYEKAEAAMKIETKIASIHTKGQDDYVDITSILFYSNQFTLESWIYTTYTSVGLNGDDQAIISKALWDDDGGGDVVLKLRKAHTNNGLSLVRHSGGEYQAIDTTEAVPINTWVQV